MVFATGLVKIQDVIMALNIHQILLLKLIDIAQSVKKMGKLIHMASVLLVKVRDITYDELISHYIINVSMKKVFV